MLALTHSSLPCTMNKRDLPWTLQWAALLSSHSWHLLAFQVSWHMPSAWCSLPWSHNRIAPLPAMPLGYPFTFSLLFPISMSQNLEVSVPLYIYLFCVYLLTLGCKLSSLSSLYRMAPIPLCSYVHFSTYYSISFIWTADSKGSELKERRIYQNMDMREAVCL